MSQKSSLLFRCLAMCSRFLRFSIRMWAKQAIVQPMKTTGKMMMAIWEQRPCQVFVFERFSYQLQHICPAGTFLLSQKLMRRKMKN